MKEVGARLHVWPAVCAIPWWSAEGRLIGIGDVVGLQGMKYAKGGDGKQIEVFSLQDLDSHDAKLAEELKKARTALVELLSEHDDEMVEKYLEADEDHLAILPSDITASLRCCTLQHPQIVVPVFAGASFRNVGVQPLLDAVIDLLPPPHDRPDPEVSLGSSGTKGGLSAFLSGKLVAAPAPDQTKTGSKALRKDKASLALQNLEACALAFKVVADARRGVLVYVRVYSGAIGRNAPLWNTSLQTTERAQRLLKMYANDAVDIESIFAGQIGVIPGLKFARTGDTLVSYTGVNPKHGPPAPINDLLLRPIEVPPPVFFVSVEPNSLAEEKHIKESLDLLLREDPSLHVSVDEESGQTHLAGMGELHLEIARDRLITDLKAKARIGRIEIGYREAITAASALVHEIFDREVGGKSSRAGCSASVAPASDGPLSPPLTSDQQQTQTFHLPDNNRLDIILPPSSPANLDPSSPTFPSHLPLPTLLPALQTGVQAALARGPTHAYPLHSTQITLPFNNPKILTDHLTPTTTPAALTSAARLAVQKALRASAEASETVLMEPVMRAAITVNEEALGAVVHDISAARGGSVISLDSSNSTTTTTSSTLSPNTATTTPTNINTSKIYAPPDPFASASPSSDALAHSNIGGAKTVIARVPLKEMVGYLRHLRALTAGRGTFTMGFEGFERMGGRRLRVVLGEMRGEV